MSKNIFFENDRTDDIIIEKSKPRNNAEQKLLDTLLEDFGEFTNIPRISKILKISRTSLYTANQERKFVTYSAKRRIIVFTKTLLYFIRVSEENKN